MTFLGGCAILYPSLTYTPMKTLLLQLIGLIVASLETDSNDASRIKVLEDSVSQLKKDIAATRGDSAFADSEVQAALDIALEKAREANFEDADGDGIPDSLQKKLDDADAGADSGGEE